MISRRRFLTDSLFSSGAAFATGILSPSVIRHLHPAHLETQIVSTTLGKLRGAFAEGVYSFKGVHYGSSTSGALRFQPPQPPRAWNGIHDALQIGPPAPQDKSRLPSPVSGMPIPDLIGPGQMSENCLVLNLWTPSLRGSKRPVMVWLHGGAYSVGSSGASMYDGANLAAGEDVVVVGVNHRLNIFGFLYLDKIAGEKYADSGNAGMLDIVLALRWIRDNIAQFGGDPGNVTVFGQSGGGGKVSVLMAMPYATGLFHKAIVQSGSEIRVNTSEEADEAARKFLAHIGIESSRINLLEEMPMDRLIAEMHSMKDPDPMNTFAPVVDSRSLPRHPFDPGAPPVSANVPMIIGTNLTETTNLLGLANPGLFSLRESQLRSALKTALGLADSKLEPLIDACTKDHPAASPGEIYFALTTDQMIRNDAITQAERKAAQAAAPAYMYLFSWQTPVLGGKLQSPHGIEIPFIFENLREAHDRIGTGSNLQSLAQRVSRAWATFARTGNPGHSGIPPWPAYTLHSRATMILDDTCKVVNDPEKEERLAWRAFAKTSLSGAPPIPFAHPLMGAYPRDVSVLVARMGNHRRPDPRYARHPDPILEPGDVHSTFCFGSPSR